MGKSSSPPAPDYRGAAEEQAESSERNLTRQTWANRPEVQTPWGNQSWTPESVTDPSTGEQVTKWTSNINLSPQQQAALDSQFAIQQGRSQAAQDLLGQATSQFQQQIDYGQMPGRTGSIDPFSFSGQVQRGLTSNPEQIRAQAQEAAWQAQKPMLDEARADTENKLANMGLARGSEAWNREARRLDDSEARARLLSMDAGRQEAAQMFGQDLQAMNAENNALGQEATLLTSLGAFQNNNRNQAIAEEMQRRGYSLNELNALLTGQQVNMPQLNANTPNSTSGQAQTANYMGAMQNQHQAAIDAYNVNQANENSTYGALASIAAFAFSDARLKEDIETLGLLPSGIRVVHYRYRGLPGRYVGVIAQEVAAVRPDAVICDPSGFLKVDYSKV